MAQYFLSKPEEWKMRHIPFTPYYLARDPETRLWRLVEKQIFSGQYRWGEPPVYGYRIL